MITFGILRVWEVKRFDIPKGWSLLYIKVVRVFQKGVSLKVIESQVYLTSSVIGRTHHQFAEVATMCFCQPFDNHFILGDERLENLKTPGRRTP